MAIVAVDAEVAGAPTQKSQAAAEKGQVNTKDEVKSLFKKCKNTIHVASLILYIEHNITTVCSCVVLCRWGATLASVTGQTQHIKSASRVRFVCG